MTIRILGEHPLAVDREGRLLTRIATIFPRSKTLVTLPGIHAMQRVAYISEMNAARLVAGLPKLDE